jgi:hypothetical protein
MLALRLHLTQHDGPTMSSIARRIAEIAAALPPDKQAEVLDFVEFLKARARLSDVPTPGRRLGTLAGQWTTPDDFDAPMPPELQRYFEGDNDGVLGAHR